MGCPVQSQEFVSMILVGHFQLRIIYDAVDSAGNAALRGGYELLQALLGAAVGQKDNPWMHQLQGSSEPAHG